MSGLDLRLVPAYYLQQYFVDKDTGEALANGLVYFWQDEARTIPKTVYQISGTPPNYTYVALPNPVQLSAVGTPMNASNEDVVIYFFPYDGTPDPGDSDGNLELYFIQVYSSLDGIVPAVLQFTREGEPNVGSNGPTATNIVNFIPNGQFVAHNFISSDGTISDPSTSIAPGGWSFETPSGTTSVNKIQFDRFAQYVTSPTASPRFRCTVICSSADGTDQFKDLRVKFSDVNKFASSTQQYTAYFEGFSNTISSVPVSLYVIKNFGTGGSPSSQTETLITTFTVTASTQQFQTSFVFGDNLGKIIGTNNDDYVELAFRFPVVSTFSASVVDFVLVENAVTITEFPQTTDGDFKARGIAGFMPTPAYDGSDLGKTLTVSKEGLSFQAGGFVGVGDISMSIFAPTSGSGYFLCDGSKYLNSGSQPDGIPNSRLGTLMMAPNLSTTQFPLYGTGSDFVTSYYNTTNTKLCRLVTNSPGAVAATANGAIPTSFLFETNGSSLNSDMSGYRSLSNKIVVYGNTIGDTTAVAAGTSGMTLTQIYNQSNYYQIFSLLNTQTSTALQVGVSSPAKYFRFSSVATDYYMWFKVGGQGLDPSGSNPGRTGIELDLITGLNADDVTMYIRERISGSQITTITYNAAATITPGSYFTFSAPSGNFYVWYFVAGVGTDPAPGGTGIKVSLPLGTETEAQVATATQLAINSLYYAVPDFRGRFLRMLDLSSGWDPDASSRYSNSPNSVSNGDVIGTDEFMQNFLHSHTYTRYNTQHFRLNSSDPTELFWGNNSTQSTSSVGGSEARPVNTNIYYKIKY